jgi:hypothetical protein
MGIKPCIGERYTVNNWPKALQMVDGGAGDGCRCSETICPYASPLPFNILPTFSSSQKFNIFSLTFQTISEQSLHF